MNQTKQHIKSGSFSLVIGAVMFMMAFIGSAFAAGLSYDLNEVLAGSPNPNVAPPWARVTYTQVSPSSVRVEVFNLGEEQQAIKSMLFNSERMGPFTITAVVGATGRNPVNIRFNQDRIVRVGYNWDALVEVPNPEFLPKGGVFGFNLEVESGRLNTSDLDSETSKGGYHVAVHVIRPRDNFAWIADGDPVPLPEASTLAGIGVTLAGLGCIIARKRKV